MMENIFVGKGGMVDDDKRKGKTRIYKKNCTATYCISISQEISIDL
jgi:hypothetical protein